MKIDVIVSIIVPFKIIWMSVCMWCYWSPKSIVRPLPMSIKAFLIIKRTKIWDRVKPFSHRQTITECGAWHSLDTNWLESLTTCVFSSEVCNRWNTIASVSLMKSKLRQVYDMQTNLNTLVNFTYMLPFSVHQHPAGVLKICWKTFNMF